ncbi:glycosyltransferase family 2 protein [Photobacterium phosphoreum]|uniref:glycosyltransferase family 2 protein n=1 Tax=Photobacterium phosphoreum TaxID=659 RepID=UPI0030B975A6
MILVSYNTELLTLDCIRSIHEHVKGINFEVILVDNDSKDNTIKLVETSYPDTIIIQNMTNLGFGSANNIGVKRAKGKYCFFLNTDTILLNNAVKILFDAITSNDEISAVCGNLDDENELPAISYSSQFTGIKFEIKGLFFNFTDKLKIFNNIFNYSSKHKIIPGSLSGADFMISKDVPDQISGFDENFFLYYEETDLFLRLNKNGCKVASIPNAKIIHLEGKSEKVKEKTLERTFNSRNFYFIKHHSQLYKHICDFIFKLTCKTRIVIFSFFKNEVKLENWKTIEKIFIINNK